MPLFKKKRAITAGAVVTLKSGGRMMTVDYVTDENRARCVYDDPTRGFVVEYLSVQILRVKSW